MDKIISSVTQLYLLYKDEPEMLKKLNLYVAEKLPNVLEEYSKDKKKEKEINKVSKIYINNFLTNPDKQFFYINKDIDTFAQYDGKDYTTITEDDLWFYILTDIPKKHYILKDVKQNIKNILIEEIKKRSIFSTIPESSTVQNIINFFCPIIIETKEETKFFFSIIGDIILNKFTSFEDEKIFFISQK